MRIKRTFPIEILLIDFISLILTVALSVYFVICGDYTLALLLLSIVVGFFGLITFFAYLYSRLYINIYSKQVEIRKYFKVYLYDIKDCSFLVEEINRTIQGDIIYKFQLAYKNQIVLEINSNSLAPEYRTSSFMNKLLECNHITKGS